MNKYIMRINFFWDDGDDIWEFEIFVPSEVTAFDVSEILIKSHEFLDAEDTENFYWINGRNPETLLDYVCEMNGWNWKPFYYDIDLNMGE